MILGHRLKTLDYAYLGSPFCCVASSEAESFALNIAYLAEPFVAPDNLPFSTSYRLVFTTSAGVADNIATLKNNNVLFAKNTGQEDNIGAISI